MNEDTGRQIEFYYLGRNGRDGRKDGLGQPSQLVGQPLTNAKLSELFLSQEARNWRDGAFPTLYTERDALRNENASLKANLTAVQTALANEQAKPPKEVVKEVEKIVTEYVDRPVEVIVEVEPGWLTATIAFIRKVLRIS